VVHNGGVDMKNRNKLTKSLSEEQFENGYWYIDEIKSFAKEIGIAHCSKLRKDELEVLVKNYLRTRKIGTTQRKNITTKGIRDSELGLKLKLPVSNYTNNKETKEFIEMEALKMNPQFRRKSGSRYRLNRWRDEQITKGNNITYGDLVKEYVKLNAQVEPFEKIPHGRYINFVANYLANEPNAKRKDAIAAWKILKKLDIPKDYISWKEQQKNSKRK